MLNSREVLFRYVIAAVLFIIAGTGVLAGKAVTICSIIGVVELATAMTRYSPLMDVLEMIPIQVHMTKPLITIKKA